MKEEYFHYFLIEIVLKLIVSHKPPTSIKMITFQRKLFRFKSMTGLVYHRLFLKGEDCLFGVSNFCDPLKSMGIFY